MSRGPARQLTRQARRLLGLSLVPLLLLVLLLAGLQAYRAWSTGLAQAAGGLAQQRQAFDTLARDADRHVAELARVYRQAAGEQQVPPVLQQALQPRAGGGHTLVALSEAQRLRSAQLLWGESAVAPERLAQARAVGRLAEGAHARQAELVWSYVFSWPQRGLLLYPWVPSQAVMESLGQASLPAGLDGWYAYEVVTQGLAEGASAYWTRPYLDAGGQGAMVSHAAPVREGGTLIGIAGTDLRLQALEAPLAALPAGPWRAWLLDRRGPLLADRQLALPRDRLVPAAERLPAPLLASLAEAAAGMPLAAPGWRFIVQPVSGTPWQLLLAAPNGELAAALLPPLLPYALLLAALFGLWLWGHLMLGRRIVLPLLTLFEHLLALAREPTLPAPQLGPRWRPWVERLRALMAESQQAQRAQREAEALKSAVIDHAQIALIVIDADDRVREYNPAAEALLGHPRAALIGQALHPVICPQRFRAMNLAAIAQMRAGDPERLAGRRLQRRVLQASGEEIPVELVMWTLRTDDAGGALVTLSLRDLRAQRESEALIERQRDALRQSEKLTAMGSLLASVAHELNNPLTIVAGRAALLEEACTGMPQAQDAARVREAAERCARIVKTFLTMARSRAPQRQALQLNTLAQAAAELLAYTLRSHGVELELQLDPEPPVLQGDPDQLGQVVLNLLINAQQALLAQAGPRHLLLRCGHDAAQAWLRVADNGPGVPAPLREAIFDPFFSTKGEGSGTGLGLSVSRGIAREHGGDLLLLAAEAGACFELRLPLSP